MAEFIYKWEFQVVKRNWTIVFISFSSCQSLHSGESFSVHDTTPPPARNFPPGCTTTVGQTPQRPGWREWQGDERTNVQTETYQQPTRYHHAVNIFTHCLVQKSWMVAFIASSSNSPVKTQPPSAPFSKISRSCPSATFLSTDIAWYAEGQWGVLVTNRYTRKSEIAGQPLQHRSMTHMTEKGSKTAFTVMYNSCLGVLTNSVGPRDSHC